MIPASIAETASSLMEQSNGRLSALGKLIGAMSVLPLACIMPLYVWNRGRVRRKRRARPLAEQANNFIAALDGSTQVRVRFGTTAIALPELTAIANQHGYVHYEDVFGHFSHIFMVFRRRDMLPPRPPQPPPAAPYPYPHR